MSAAAPTADQAGAAFDRRLVAPMVLGSILNPVNSSIITVSLVPIGVAFGAPAARTAWLVSGLYLATAIGQPVVGRLVDVHGPRRLFLAGSTLVGLAGLLGALAPSLAVLVVARVLLGFGTCAGYPAAMFLIRREAGRTGHASPTTVLTTLSVSTQTIAAVGPTLGGLLIAVGGWRATFAINVPLAALAVVIGALRLPRHHTLPSSEPHDAAAPPALDVAGMLAFAGTLISLLLFLLHPGLALWYLPVAALALGVVFVACERRAAAPFVDLRVLAGNRPLLATYARAFLTACIGYAFLYGFTQWLQQGRALSPSAAGLVLLPVFAVGILVATVTGRRRQVRAKLLIGASCQVIVSGGLLLADRGSPVWLIVILAAVMGVPQGLVNLANQNTLYHQADPARMGSSAGLLRTCIYLGAIVSSVAGGLAFPHRADTPGLHHLAAFMLLASAAFVVLTVADRSLSRIGAPHAGASPSSQTRKRNPCL